MAESAVNDFCRLCKENCRKGDRLHHTKKIYEREGHDNKSVFQRLASVGLLLQPQVDRSFRICQKCFRLVRMVEESVSTLRKWKLSEGTALGTSQAAIKPKEGETGPAAIKPKEEEETGPAAIKIKKEEETSPEPAASIQSTITTTPETTPTAPQTEKRSRESPSTTPQTVKRPRHHDRPTPQTPWTPQTPDTGTATRKSLTTVMIQYPSAKSTTLTCPTSTAGIVQNIAKGKWSTAANLIMKHDMLLDKIKESVLIPLDDECKRLCQPKQDFMLFRCSPDELTAFSFAKMESDLQRLAPFLFSLLSTVTNHSPLQTCAAAAILLRGRHNTLPSAFAYYINSVLEHGGAKKAVFERLCKFGISTNHNTAVRKRRSLADVHVVMQFSSSGFGLFIEGDNSELQPPVSAILEHLQGEGE